MRNRFITLLAAMSFAATTANAAPFDAKIQELFNTGYTHFEVSQRITTSRIEAYAPDGSKSIVIIENQGGTTVSEQKFVGTTSDYSSATSRIAERLSDTHVSGVDNVSNETHIGDVEHVSNETYSTGADNDSNETHVGSVDNAHNDRDDNHNDRDDDHNDRDDD